MHGRFREQDRNVFVIGVRPLNSLHRFDVPMNLNSCTFNLRRRSSSARPPSDEHKQQQGKSFSCAISIECREGREKNPTWWKWCRRASEQKAMVGARLLVCLHAECCLHFRNAQIQCTFRSPFPFPINIGYVNTKCTPNMFLIRFSRSAVSFRTRAAILSSKKQPATEPKKET